MLKAQSALPLSNVVERAAELEAQMWSHARADGRGVNRLRPWARGGGEANRGLWRVQQGKGLETGSIARVRNPIRPRRATLCEVWRLSCYARVPDFPSRSIDGVANLEG